MNIYITIVLDPDGPYVWSDDTCGAEADMSAVDARHETGYATVVKCVEV
jgi:hypothetical protein